MLLEHSPSQRFHLSSSSRFGFRSPMAEAMDVGDEVKEDTIPILISGSLASIQTGKAGSPEDIAWVDSCLIKESDISDDHWNSLKAALIDILNSHPVTLGSSSGASNGSHQETDTEIHHSSEETEPTQIAIREQLKAIDDDAHRNNDIPISKDANDLLSFTFQGNPFLPGYNDDLGVTENFDLGVSMDSWAHEIEPSTQDIFRVWNLEVPEEEDELVKQLNSALEEGLPQSLPSNFPDSDAWKNLEETSVDDLVAGIADLSLNQVSS
ncbi:uncharacterized protein LOC126784420 [Argentina anserina]|uniref:uncharacterized protein LOC126784420 n=1 Tax=Argentina anserina TaxID=57926 RepID=UPI0021766B98|nr:uncharacterized protein LOC126784420 [Potentilla anserina]